jgi:extracellular factor (EF) 3-hydroxypalmitic acid methyl ester biosynthesis protein
MSMSEYEELSGGVGRSVHFRSERYQSRTLMGSAKPSVFVGGQQVSLYDVSMNGLSYFPSPEADLPEVGTEHAVSMSFDTIEAFSGRARIVRVEDSASRSKIAMAILEDFIDIPRLATVHDSFAFEKALAQGTANYALVPSEYRDVVSQVATFLGHWKDLLDRREDEIGRSEVALAEDSLEVAERKAEEAMRVEWSRLRLAANEASLTLDRDRAAFHAAKRLTELMVTPLLKEAPLWWRAYTKPFGYPGDFVMMRYMYEETRRGESMFGRVMHQLGREERLAATVTSRKQLLLEHLERVIREAPPGPEPLRIACLASGPATEVEEFLSTYDGARKIHWTLIDQDDRALSHANERVTRAGWRCRGRIRVSCLFTSFKQLVSDPRLVDEFGEQHFIYSAGFFDYLTEPVARQVAETCFRLVEPGGRVLFGNAARRPDVHWAPEFVLDWRLLYRSEEDVRALFPDTADANSIKLISDSSDSWHFLEARREK